MNLFGRVNSIVHAYKRKNWLRTMFFIENDIRRPERQVIYGIRQVDSFDYKASFRFEWN